MHQEWEAFYVLMFFLCYGAQRKDRSFIQCVFLVYLVFFFSRKIGIFHMQISCIHQRMALKETNIFTKAIKNTQTHECMYESEFVLVIQLL